MSESEGEEVTAQEVTLPQDLPGRGNTQSSRSAVRLTEVHVLHGLLWLYTVEQVTFTGENFHKLAKI